MLKNKLFQVLVSIIFAFWIAFSSAYSTTLLRPMTNVNDAYLSGAGITILINPKPAYDCLITYEKQTLRHSNCKQHFFTANGQFRWIGRVFPREVNLQAAFYQGFVDSYKFYENYEFDLSAISFPSTWNKQFYTTKLFKEKWKKTHNIR